MPVTPFGCPLRRRTQGFGCCSADREVRYTDGIPVWLAFHYAWEFLDPSDRGALLSLPHMRFYAGLRRDASVRRNSIIRELQTARLPHDIEQGLDHFRSRFLGAALLSFNFDYGDLIRWMEGEYTDNNRDFAELIDCMERARSFKPRPGYPPIDYDRIIRAHTEGVPLKGSYRCSQRDTFARIQYDNHPPLREAMPDVRKKFAKEEARSLHLALPREVAFFMPGLMISPISWVVRKGKGRIVIDSSTKLNPSEKGNVNDQIPKQGTPGGEDECPPVFYGNAFARNLVYIWNLRITCPREEILLHVDDIDAAFRRMVYHPDLAVAFAYVFGEFLIIPVGMIFGSRNSPSWFCQTAELRAHFADCLDFSHEAYDMEDDMVWAAPPTDAEIRSFSRAVADALNPGCSDEFMDRFHNTMFVDDNCAAAVAARMKEGMRNAVGSARVVLQNPNDTRRPKVLQKEKWDELVSYYATYLGLVINTRTMTVTRPTDKVAELRGICAEWLAHRRAPKTPRDAAKLLGLVRCAASLAPQGVFFSLQLQHTLNGAVTSLSHRKPAALRRWWRSSTLRVPNVVFAHLALLHTLTDDPTVWCRNIGLLIPREPTAVALSDAAYTGLGGWSPDFRFLWRLTRDHLVEAGFAMREIEEDDRQSRASDDSTLHINILEFVGIIINLWFVIKFLRDAPAPIGGHIVLLRGDNTTSVSCFNHAARIFTAELQPHSGEGKRRGGRNVATGEIPDPTFRYRTLLPAADLSGFPSTLRSAIQASQRDFVHLDRGRSRQGNDGSFSTRAAYFGEWARRQNIERRFLSSLSPSALLTLMGYYLECILQGDNCKGLTDLDDKTVYAYLRAAVTWLEFHCGVTVPLFQNNGGTKKQEKLDPYLSEIIGQRRIWGTKKDKREALDCHILKEMARQAEIGAKKHPWHKDVVLFDVVAMASFTGSRVSEYGQLRASPPKGKSGPTPYWSPLPVNRHIPPKWQGTPEAFIRDDFQFYDGGGRRMSHAMAVRLPSRVASVHIRFRYDKSNHNMVIRKFQRINDHVFCVIRATLALVQRSLDGLCSAAEPICMYQTEKGRRCCVTDANMKKFMQDSCIAAHPDEEHYLRINIKLLTSHSLRVFAAVLLSNAGIDLEDIKFRLRWYSDAVKEYIRDCPRTTWWISAKAFESAFLDRFAPASAAA